jgi:hypothetical protein
MLPPTSTITLSSCTLLYLLPFLCKHKPVPHHYHWYWRVVRGGHGLPKVLPEPAMPYPSTPCQWTTTETVLWLFQGWPTRRAGGLWPSSTPLDTPHHTPIPLTRFRCLFFEVLLTLLLFRNRNQDSGRVYRLLFSF